jgi:hypothetical protein
MALSFPTDVTAVDTGDGLVLLDQKKGRYWQLNGAGAAALRMLVDGESPQAVAASLARDFPGASQRALADVDGLVGALIRARLVVVS